MINLKFEHERIQLTMHFVFLLTYLKINFSAFRALV